MSTQPSTESDLDRTEELPQLDVAAYEASMAEVSTSSTDTWSVHALRDATLDEEEGEEHSPVSPLRSRAQRVTPERSADLTLDAERILTRVAQLEAELIAANARNEEFAQRCESLETNIADRSRAVQALQADNARLTEQHSIGIAKVQSLEQQLQARTTEFEAQAQRFQTSQANAIADADATRRRLEQRIAALLGEVAGLNDTNARLQEELRAAADRLQVRIDQIEELEDRLEEQEDNAAQMARYLAAKLVEHDVLSAVVEQRDHAMRELQSTCEDLTEQLQQADVHLSETMGRAEAAERSLAAALEAKRERDHEVEARDREIETKNREIEARSSEIVRMRADADAAAALVEQLETRLTAAESKHAEAREQSEQFEMQLAGGQRHVEALTAELARAREQIAVLERSSSELTATHAALDAKRDELDRANERIAALQSRIEDLDAKIAAQERQLEATAAELERACEHAAQSAPAIEELEVALQARGELVETLRAELKAAHEERAMVDGQLLKARTRNKTLAREVFQRDKRIATLQEDLAVHVETLAAIGQDVNRVGTEPHTDAEPQWILEALGHEGAAILLNRKVITVGRTSDNDACIPSKLVSRHHARLLVGPNAVVVEDAGSTNGCYVNDRLVKQQLMHDGDVLSLGDLRYRLRTVSAPPVRVRDNVVSMVDRGESE